MGAAATEADELRAMIDKAISLPQSPPRSVAQARARNAARMLAISYLAQQALDDALEVIVPACGASYAEAYISVKQYALNTLADMAEEARGLAA